MGQAVMGERQIASEMAEPVPQRFGGEGREQVASNRSKGNYV